MAEARRFFQRALAANPHEDSAEWHGVGAHPNGEDKRSQGEIRGGLKDQSKQRRSHERAREIDRRQGKIDEAIAHLAKDDPEISGVTAGDVRAGGGVYDQT